MAPEKSAPSVLEWRDGAAPRRGCVLEGEDPRFGDFGLASGADSSGTYQHVWFEEEVGADEVTIDADVYLLTKARAKALKTSAAVVGAGAGTVPVPGVSQMIPITSLPPVEPPAGSGVGA